MTVPNGNQLQATVRRGVGVVPDAVRGLISLDQEPQQILHWQYELTTTSLVSAGFPSFGDGFCCVEPFCAIVDLLVLGVCAKLEIAKLIVKLIPINVMNMFIR